MLVFSLDGHLSAAEKLVSTLSVNVLDDEIVMLDKLELHHFPDGESYLNILSDVDQQEVVVLCQLHQPNEKIIDLMLFAEAAKQQGAKSICLVAPYLAYLRQDKKFQAGESITSRPAATWISEYFDSIITIDPHLHRYHSLNKIRCGDHYVEVSLPPLGNYLKRSENLSSIGGSL